MAASKLRNAIGGKDEDRGLDMSPMIDMVFLLLIFFIVNATAIIVKTDPLVKPPIAGNSKPQEDGRGRIVVNVRDDGTYWSENGVKLADDKDIEALVKEQKAKIDLLGIKPKLHLRGDKEAVFRYSRVVIRAAARAQVNEVVFAVFRKARSGS
jgi:biopolymer transport protein ExbD